MSHHGERALKHLAQQSRAIHAPAHLQTTQQLPPPVIDCTAYCSLLLVPAPKDATMCNGAIPAGAAQASRTLHPASMRPPSQANGPPTSG